MSWQPLQMPRLNVSLRIRNASSCVRTLSLNSAVPAQPYRARQTRTEKHQQALNREPSTIVENEQHARELSVMCDSFLRFITSEEKKMQRCLFDCQCLCIFFALLLRCACSPLGVLWLLLHVSLYSQVFASLSMRRQAMSVMCSRPSMPRDRGRRRPRWDSFTFPPADPDSKSAPLQSRRRRRS